MPARDRYHAAVRKALEKDGWTITHDPFTISFGPSNVFADIGAERVIAAVRGLEKIAVEVKTFKGASAARDLENAVGQFVYYHSLRRRTEPERHLYLAVSADTYDAIFTEPGAQAVVEDHDIALVTFDVAREEIVKWIT